MALSENEKIKLKKLLKELGKIKGRHTELVTVYIPAGFNLYDMSSTLRNEQSTASNIKSKSVRKNVMSALEKILGYIALYKKTPTNGLAIFCGNVSEKEGVADIKLWAVEPPEPLKAKLYWCSQQFDLGPLQDMVAEREVYGIICLDRAEANISLLIGKKFENISHMESIVPGKSRAGGQSSARFSRVREGLKQDWFKSIAEVVNKSFREHPEILGIIVSGPGPTKEEFLREDLLYADIKKKILGTVDTSYTGDTGLEETVERGQDLLKESAVVRERNLLNRFFSELQKPKGLAVYGLEKTLEALHSSMLETLILSEGSNFKQIEFECGHEKSKLILPTGQKPEPCSVCGQIRRIVSEVDLVDVLDVETSEYGAKLIMVSSDTKEGQQFLALGGIGGFLRFRA